MKGFIEITVLETKRKMLISVGEIKYVREYIDNAEIVIGLAIFPKNKWTDAAVYAIESYAEVIAKIAEATK